MRNATRLLSEIQQGDAEAANQLLNLVQAELRQIAGKIWGDWQPGQTLQPTLLMDMAWEKLVGFDGDLKKIVPTTLLAADLKDLLALAHRLADPADAVSEFVHRRLRPATIRMLAESRAAPEPPPDLPASLARDLNDIIMGPLIYDEGRFAMVPLRPETRQLLPPPGEIPKGLGRLNRLLLEDAYPAELSRELHKEQFLRFAATTMKRIMWEAKEKKKLKPAMDGGDALDNFDVAGEEAPADRLMAVQDAVDELATVHPQAGALVKLLCYEGKSIPEAAAEMKITLITAKRRWQFAKAWLFNKLKRAEFA